MTSILVLTITGILMAVAIGLVVHFFGLEPDPRAEKLMAIMTGANCGGCGFAGCGAYAKAMLEGKARPGLCPSMSAENIAKASAILGVEADVLEPKVAVVCCNGDDCMAARHASYNGVNDCQNAALVAGGGKGCTYGCMGLGACARACPFGAIEMTDRHLAVVHPELCTGCGKCTKVCPRHIIELVPRTAKIHVFCSSPANAKLKRQFCKGGCIGCHKCDKTAGEGHFTFNSHLASVNYANPPDPSVADVCPTGCLKRVDK